MADGHNEKAQCQSHFASLQKEKHINLCRHAKILFFFDCADSLRGDFPLQ